MVCCGPNLSASKVLFRSYHGEITALRFKIERKKCKSIIRWPQNGRSTSTESSNHDDRLYAFK